MSRTLSQPGRSGFDVVRWRPRSVAIHDADGAVVFSCEAIEAPTAWSANAVAVVARRYCAYGPAGAVQPIRDLVARVVDVISGWAQGYGQAGGAAEARILADELTALVVSQRATFATPVWLNVGMELAPLTSACFILAAEDSISGLLEWNTREGLIFQQGGGTGINLSAIRSSRERVSRGGLASGPLSFMRATDAWAATMRAGGRARRGAKMVVLDAWHPDIYDFIAAKAREEERGRALAAAGYPAGEVTRSLAYQQTNHSVRVSDAFMRAVQDGGEWALRAVTTGETLDVVPARDLLRACARAAWACGDPGLQFADRIAEWHTCPAAGPVTASNPCGEFLSIADSACNLATVNLLAFLDGGRFDTDAFRATVGDLVLAMDAIVDGSGYPTETIAAHARALRPIGIGFANLGALLLALGIPYDSDAGRAWAAAIAALMTGAAYRRSAELARALHPFADFARNRRPMLRVLGQHRRALAGLRGEEPADVIDAAQHEWAAALALGRDHGFRNAQTTLVPPTGTVSIMLDCETTGVEPYYAFTTVRHLADGGRLRTASQALVRGLEALGHSTATVEALAEYALDHGHLAGALGLPAEEAAVFATATGPNRLTAQAHLRMVAAIQPLLSGGVSKTVPLLEEATVEDVEAVFLEAWRLGLKAIATYRDGSKLLQPLTADD